MASSSTLGSAAENNSILTPVMTLDGHEPYIISSSGVKDHEVKVKHISSISYLPDGKQIISSSDDKTIRRWDLREGKEIEEARQVCENGERRVGVSRDGRWVFITGWEELKVSEVETGIVRTFDEGNWITNIDISANSTLLAVGSIDVKTQIRSVEVRIWRLETGELVAGPFKVGYVGALRFSEDTRKLAVISLSTQPTCLVIEVWDIQAQKLDVQKSTPGPQSLGPVLWTTRNKSIVAPVKFTHDFESLGPCKSIYEFDASTLETVGAPFKGHTDTIHRLELSSDCALLVSSSHDHTIKLWAFESRQLLASFHIKNILSLVLSPNSRQLAYTCWDDTKIYICDIPATSFGLSEKPQPTKRSRHAGLLDSDVTHRPVSRKPAITPVMSPIPRLLPTSDPHTFLRFLHKLLPSSSSTDAVHTDIHELRNPLDYPATSPLPRQLTKLDKNSRPTPAPPTTQSSAINDPATLKSSLHRISTWWPFQTDRASPAIVDVPLAPGKLRYATAGAPSDDNDLIRDEDYVSPPSPHPGSRPGIVNTGQHGSGRFCLCF